MQRIDLRALPNQRLSFANDDDFWQLEIKVALVTMVCNIWLNDELILAGSRIVKGVPMIPYTHLAGNGNFAILTEGDDEPDWRKFEETQRLVFWDSDMAIASSRFVDLRSRHISPSLTELTSLVNTAMRIEDIGYYPPTWQALQEAISYALSVVRSHAPEQGQILLATQMLTSAMGDLIEWLSIDFAAGEWDEDLVFSRASTATYIDARRQIQEAGVDEPRITHDPETGKSQGLLIEEQWTNLLLWSEDFTQGSWGVDDNIVVTEGADSPISGVKYQRLTADQSNIRCRVAQSFSGSVNAYVTFSFFVGDHSEDLHTIIAATGVSTAERANVRLSDGVITASNGSPGIKVTPCADGKRIAVTLATDSIQDGTAYIVLTEASGSTSISQDFISAGSFAEITGLQLEQASTPSSYIPTEDAQVTRAADNVTRELGSEFNLSESTLYCEFYFDNPPTDPDGYERIYPIIGLNNEGDEPFRGFKVQADFTSFNTGTEVVLRGADSNLRIIASTSLPYTGWNRVAITYTASKIQIAMNGSYANAHGELPQDFLEYLTHMHFTGSRIAGSETRQRALNNPFRDVRLFPYALSESELIALTTPEAN